MENRNKEFKCDLAMDRLSDHRFVANYFRLYLHAAAMNLLVRLRRFIAEPLPALAPQAETAPPTSQPGEAAGPADEPCVPVEALTGAARQRHFRLRRQRDPLGEGYPCTWRTLLIKVAAEVVVRTRRIMVQLSSRWPHLEWYRRVCERLRDPSPPPVPSPSGLSTGQLDAVHPHTGERGPCVLEDAPGRNSVTNGLDARDGILTARGLNNPG
jgi:hypothetical protein